MGKPSVCIHVSLKIRRHIADIDGEWSPIGDIEIDQTYVDGKRSGKRGLGVGGKTVVMSMLEREGDSMTKVFPNVRKKNSNP